MPVCPVCNIELERYEAMALHLQLYHRAEDGIDR